MKLKFTFYIIIIVILLINLSIAQTYQGPASGSVPSGGSVTLGALALFSDSIATAEKGKRNKASVDQTPKFIQFSNGTSLKKPVYTEDKNVNNNNGNSSSANSTILLKNFKGLDMGNFIPPDPHIAVGPTHIIATVNTLFGVWDKEGNLIRTINPDNWFQGLVSNPDCFDPQVVYDHFAKKWIMTWDSQNDDLKRAHIFLAVSQDSIPLGTWYFWALPADRTGNTEVNNWGDFPQIGFDDKALYINFRAWSFADDTNPNRYQYNQIRIIDKSELYGNPGGSLSWKDIWDIGDASVSASPLYKPDVIIPAINFDTAAQNYFLHIPRYGGNFLGLYTISDPLGTPVLSRVNIPVVPFNYAPDANQKGGSSTLISSNESGMKNAPIFRSGNLWSAHSVENPSSSGNSAIRYYKIDVTNQTVVETADLGASDYWFIFPALCVDEDENIAITYSRSGLDEYCGAYFTVKLKNDPAGLSNSISLQEGKGNYDVTGGSPRNRWGDYLGACLDPSDGNNIWFFTEYAAGTNTWGTWVGAIRMMPLPGIHLYTNTPVVDFGNVELPFSSDTLTVLIKNHGDENLEITNIQGVSGPFNVISNFTFPIVFGSFDSINVRILFTPSDTGSVSASLAVESNDPIFTNFELKGKGYIIKPALNKVIYSSSGSLNGGSLSQLDKGSGAGFNIGPMLSNDVKSISINSKTNVIYGLISTFKNSSIVKVNAEHGDSYSINDYEVGELTSVAFDTSNVLYVASQNGNLYTFDSITGNLDSIAKSPIQLSSIAFNPINNQLWASIYISFGAGKDGIYKLDKITGDTTGVGKTGFGITVNGIAFDENGSLYGITGLSNQINNLISIDTSSGVGTIIGSTGLKHLTDIAYLSSNPTSTEDRIEFSPKEFSLNQNYPNPFNPSTAIEFSLPVQSDVKIKIYNLLGQLVKVLFDGSKSAGIHRFMWNSDDYNGRSVSSGIYFYEMSAVGNNDVKFRELRKMILLK